MWCMVSAFAPPTTHHPTTTHPPTFYDKGRLPQGVGLSHYHLPLASFPRTSWQFCTSRTRGTSPSRFSDSHCSCLAECICFKINKKVHELVSPFHNWFLSLPVGIHGDVVAAQERTTQVTIVATAIGFVHGDHNQATLRGLNVFGWRITNLVAVI